MTLAHGRARAGSIDGVDGAMGFELKFEQVVPPGPHATFPSTVSLHPSAPLLQVHHPISTPRGARPAAAAAGPAHGTAVERLPVDSVASRQKHKLEFSVRSGASTHYFRAQSATECNEWLRALGYRQVTGTVVSAAI